MAPLVVEVRRKIVLTQYDCRSQRVAQSMFPNVPKQEQPAAFVISDRGTVVNEILPVWSDPRVKNCAVR